MRSRVESSRSSRACHWGTEYVFGGKAQTSSLSPSHTMVGTSSSPLVTRPTSRRWARLFLFLISSLVLFHFSPFIFSAFSENPHELARRSQILSKCAYTRTKPGPPLHFHARTQSDRYHENTKPVLLRNATIWTAANDGYEALAGDLLMHRGLIKVVGDVPISLLQELESESVNLEVIDAHGAWVTPGIVDLHSHIGVGSVPELDGEFLCYTVT